MRKIGLLISSLLLGFSLSACGGGGGDTSVSSEHQHTYGSTYYVDGNYHYQVCEVCKEQGNRELHHGGTATCEHKAICEVCGAEYGELEEHSFGQWVFVEGEDTHYRECSVCGEKETKAHVFNMEIQKDEYLVGEKTEDCELGNTYYKSCVCGEHAHDLEHTFYVANSHDYSLEIVLEDDANLVAEATCTEPAKYGYVCSHNHEHFDLEHTFDYGEAKGHDYSDAHEEASSFSTYNLGYAHCEECGRYFIDIGEGDEHIYEEADYDDIFDETKIQYYDETFGTEENPYLLTCKEDIYFLRTLVNQGTDSFEGKYFKLTNDIDFDLEEDEYFGAPIGYSDTKKFKGNLDGDNHSLIGIVIHGRKDHGEKELAGDSLALFSRIENATIKNLVLENVLIDGDSQRNAALVANANNSVIENCEIKSGQVYATTEGGGIVAAIDKVAGETIIRNCINRANVTTLAASYGCSGGILGATVASNGATVVLDGNRNYGDINTTASTTLGYAGGIVGLVREVVNEGSVTIHDCLNFGDVTSVKTSIGGIAGCLRAGTVDECYHYEGASVTSSAGEAVALAGKGSAISNTGLIYGEIKNGVTVPVTNCCLCDEDGHVHHKIGEDQPWNEDATCYHVGYDEYWVCELCEKTGGDILAMTDHDLEYVITETTHMLACTNEGCTYHELEEEHQFVLSTEESIAPTLTEDGLNVYYCSKCEYKKEVVVPCSCEHTNLEHVDAIAPSCENVGLQEHYHCSDCDRYFLDEDATQQTSYDDLVIAKVDHEFIKHDARVGYAETVEEYYTCKFQDHDNSKGQYYVLEDNAYVSVDYDELVSSGSKDLDGYGTETNPYILYNAADLLAFRNEVNLKRDDEGAEIADSGNSFSGKYVELGDDIDLSGTEFGAPIGSRDDCPFSGVFDGKGHTITGFSHSGTDSVGFFSRVTNGTVKNLKMAEVSSTTTKTQRAAALVARAENAIIENCEILSGTVTGQKENGAIAAIIVNGSTIKDCVNYATVSSSTGECVGGIVGKVFSGELTISGCTNHGDVTITDAATSGNGTGGILGGSLANKSADISDCKNYGNITGWSYVGGIIGIGREDSSGASKIEACENYGDITGKGVSAGGIAGIARFNVTDCACYAGATIMLKTAGGLSSTLKAIGETKAGTAGGSASGYGYIVGTQGNSATVTGKLINLDGSDYTA